METVSDTVCPASSMDIKTIDFWRSLHRVTVASQWGIGLAKYSVSSYKGKVFKQEIQYWCDARIPVKSKRLCDRCFFHSLKFLAFQQLSLQLVTHQAKIQRGCTDKNGLRRTTVRFVLQQICPVKLSYCHVYCISWYCMPCMVFHDIIEHSIALH